MPPSTNTKQVRDDDFNRDPARYIRMATPERRVVVRDASGRVTAAIGGCFDYSAADDAREDGAR